jgi:hypothetical protein
VPACNSLLIQPVQLLAVGPLQVPQLSSQAVHTPAVAKKRAPHDATHCVPSSSRPLAQAVQIEGLVHAVHADAHAMHTPAPLWKKPTGHAPAQVPLMSCWVPGHDVHALAPPPAQVAHERSHGMQ